MRQPELRGEHARALLLGALFLLDGCSAARGIEVGSPLGGSGAITLWECSDAHAVLTVEEDDETTDQPTRRFSVTPASLAVEIARSGASRKEQVAKGVVTQFGTTQQGIWWATLGNPAGPSDAVTLWTRDSRTRQWRNVALPRRARGAILTSPTIGYSWRDAELLRTVDGAADWTPVGQLRVLDASIRRSPLTGPAGDVWLPIEKSSAGAALASVNPAGEVRIHFEWRGETLEAMQWSAPDVLIVALRSAEGKGVRIVHVDVKAGLQRELLKQDNGTLRDLRANGERIALLEIGSSMPSGLFGHWGTRLLTSSDAGKSWTTRDVTQHDLGSICVSPGGTWAVSSRTRQIFWLPD